MINKLKTLFRRFWKGPEPPVVITYTDIEKVEHEFLKPNDIEYRFPDLLKPPKVKFRMRPPRTK